MNQCATRNRVRRLGVRRRAIDARSGEMKLASERPLRRSRLPFSLAARSGGQRARVIVRHVTVTRVTTYRDARYIARYNTESNLTAAFTV